MLTALLAGLAALVLAGRLPVGAQRLAAVTPRVRAPSRAIGPAAACAVAGAAVVLVVGVPVGLVPGALVAAAGPRLLVGLEPAAVREERQRLLSDLPLALDLLAACLAGGAGPGAAAAAVGAAVDGPCGRRLLAVGRALAVGSSPGDAWAQLAGDRSDDPLAPAARLLARAAEGGAPVADTVARLAQDARAVARAAGEQAARRVGVLVVAPLGLCFLPAFVLLGVVPVVLGLAGPLFASL
ncbi:MAG: type II secretion system F family protein [Mycobacteriales bacterium]